MTAGTSRGRAEKRRAILEAAFTVFSRRGYDQAGVQEIADEAGVAKPTVYNHLTDKETVFRHAMQAAADTVAAQTLAIAEELREPGEDLRAALDGVAVRLLRVCCGEQAWSLHALAQGQAGRFPDVFEAVARSTSRPLAEALAARFAALSDAGRLRACDPAVAAEQFLALLTGPMQARSRSGTRRVSAAAVRDVAHAGVDTFLRAYQTSA